MVSVIIPTFNREKTISRAIQSILNQTYNNIEIIVVDDKSTDNTEEIVKNFNEEKIYYIKHSNNQGACAARNTGIKNAKGEYIAFLDSDDLWKPDKLEKQLYFLKENNSDLVFCSHTVYDGVSEKTIPHNKIKDENIFEKLLYSNFITTGAILAKQKCFEEIFDVTLPRFQDWDLVIRMCKKYKISHINEVLTENYVQDDSLTKSYEKGLIALEIIYNKYIDDIVKYPKVNANFNSKIAALSIQCDKSAIKYLKKSIKTDFKIKYIIKYIICAFKLQNLLKK